MSRFHLTRFKSKVVNLILFLLLSGVIILILSLIIRIFVFDRFIVSTPSMYPTICPKDKIFVNKLIFGPRIYKSFDFNSEKPLKSLRIKGFRSIRYNDIIVFNFPLDESWNKVSFRINHVYTKRCIGLPGDSIFIINGFYKNNNYNDTLGYYSNQLLLSKTPIKNIPSSVLRSYPINKKKSSWNIKNFGPLLIPKSGKIIILDSNNYMLYKIPIEYETKASLKLVNNRLFLDEELIEHYRFKNNYYFVVGDNIMHSSDSRYFGFIPEEFIVGVVWCIKNNIH